MRYRNMDFIDRYLELERKNRRARRRTGGGEWYDLTPHLSVAAPEVVALTEGFGIRLIETGAGSVAEFRGAIDFLTDAGGGSFLDIPMPEIYIPEGDWRDVWAGIDGDNIVTTKYPPAGGYSIDVAGKDRALGQRGHLFIDASPFVLTSVGPALQSAGAGNNNGWPVAGTSLIFNSLNYGVESL